jgi:cytoskeletal protein CcmA (bactofilin family)
LSYFSASKTERDVKPVNGAAKPEAMRTLGKTEETSTLGSGMQVVGNIVCSGALQIFGSVTGDIHAAQLAIREGARVEGKVIAPDLLIEGAFSGTIHGNTVKLQKTAVVEGEIFNKSLAIEEAARFEGVARRIERAVEAPNANSGARSAAPLDLVGGQVSGQAADRVAPPSARIAAPLTAPAQ